LMVFKASKRKEGVVLLKPFHTSFKGKSAATYSFSLYIGVKLFMVARVLIISLVQCLGKGIDGELVATPL